MQPCSCMPPSSANSSGRLPNTALAVSPQSSAASRSLAQKTSTGTAAATSQTGMPAVTGSGRNDGNEITMAPAAETAAATAGRSLRAASVVKKRQQTSRMAKSRQSSRKRWAMPSQPAEPSCRSTNDELRGQAPSRCKGIETANSAASSARPRAMPRRLERATVALRQSPLKRASKAASLSPQRSRAHDSPTDQASRPSAATGRMPNIVRTSTNIQVVSWREVGPNATPSAAGTA